MAGLNKVMLIGNLGRDPEVRFTGGGSTVANFTLATNERWTSKEGNREERTEWHRIVAFGKLADFCKDYLSKGKQVYVEGRLQTRQWEDRDGNKRSTTEIVALNIMFVGRRGEDEPPRSSGGGGSGDFEPMPPGPDEGDIPF